MSEQSSMHESQFSDGGWMEWFCNLEDHQFFCEVDQAFVKDSFNLYGLKAQFPRFEEALDMILSPEAPADEDLENEKFISLYQEATDLYGLIHSRYAQSTKGLALIRERFLQGRYGQCPRVFCGAQNLIPIGLTDELRVSRVKTFCPKCEDVYVPKKKCADVDGAYFGTALPHVLLMTYPDIVPSAPTLNFVPKVYGFKLHGKKTGGPTIKADKTGTQNENEVIGAKKKEDAPEKLNPSKKGKKKPLVTASKFPK